MQIYSECIMRALRYDLYEVTEYSLFIVFHQSHIPLKSMMSMAVSLHAACC